MNMPDRNARRTEDPTRLDLHPADPPPAPAAPEYPQRRAPETVVEDGVVDPRRRRARVVSVVCTVINVVCGFFAVILALHIVLVIGEANPANGFAAFIESWSAGVSLGLRGLFAPGNAKLEVLVNDGLAALGWLVIAGVLTYLIRRLALPGPRRAVRYRRVVR
ncbi:hypothetical protein [Amycolatopsis sp. cmx-4-54]|uniref:hypothetical protein n=1 Tax=Amycolatopsis sp. cmx-4-54 TaxID=2790936 RepID=UPI00397D877E